MFIGYNRVKYYIISRFISNNFQQEYVGGTWQITAQNGFLELRGNLMHSCAWHLLQDQEMIIKAFHCAENVEIPGSPVTFEEVQV